MTHHTEGKARKFFNGIVANLSFVGAIWIVLLMFIVFADVVGRGVFNSPIAGVPEIVKNSIVGITFLQITHVLRKGRHVRTTAFYDRAPDQLKRILDIFINLAGLVVFIIIFYSTLEPTHRAYVTGDFEGNNVRIPTLPTHVLILLGSLLMVNQFALNILDALRGKSPEKEQ